MLVALVLLAVVVFRKEVKEFISGTKIVARASFGDVLDDAKEQLRARASKLGMVDADKASINDVITFLNNN